MSANMDSFADDGLDDQYVDLFQTIANRVADAAAALVEAVQSKPLVAAAILVAGLAAVIGWKLGRRKKGAAARVADVVESRAKPLRKVVDYGELVGLAMKLAENPIVRGYVVGALSKRLSQRFK